MRVRVVLVELNAGDVVSCSLLKLAQVVQAATKVVPQLGVVGAHDERLPQQPKLRLQGVVVVVVLVVVVVVVLLLLGGVFGGARFEAAAVLSEAHPLVAEEHDEHPPLARGDALSRVSQGRGV